MRTTLPLLFGTTAILLCLTARAQEAAPPPPAASPTAGTAPAAPVDAATPVPAVAAGTDAAATPAQAAPAPAPSPSPAPAPAPEGWTLRQVAPQPAWDGSGEVFPQGDVPDDRTTRRALRRKEKERIRLERVMEIEGPEFDEQKYDTYRNEKAGGITLVALGGVGLIMTIFYGFYVILDDGLEDWDDNDMSEAEQEYDNEHLGEPRQRAALWTMFLTGITGIAVGVPLLITGMRGAKRQDLLRRKDEILAPYDPATARLSLFASPEGGGGLRLSVEF